MFEAAELDRKLSKPEYKAAVAALRPRLVALGQALRESNLGVIAIVGGVEGAGKSEVINRLCEWLDPRGVEVHSFFEPTDDERERPFAWRFWRRLPARGRIGIFFGSWYTDPIIARAQERNTIAEFDDALDQIVELEAALVADGYVLIKLWFHLDRDTLRKRLRKAKQAVADEAEAADRQAESERGGDNVARGAQLRARTRAALRISPLAHKFQKRYKAFSVASERALRHTGTGVAPWQVIEATDDRYRDVTAAEHLATVVESALAEQRPRPRKAPQLEVRDKVTVLDRVDVSRTLDEETAGPLLDAAQDRLFRLAWQAHKRNVATVIAFEGWDAAGKGGAIRRLTGSMDARLVSVVPVAAPTDEERKHPWLWRFWRHLPRDGRVVIFDRTWYGRVLVERVEGFAQPNEWRRAYHEINAFEEALTRHGAVVVKCWLHISPEEQLRRFEERQATEWKRYKITDEDWRNREKWGPYSQAIHDMVAQTSTADAPWTLISANCKRNARVEIVTTVADALERRLRR